MDVDGGAVVRQNAATGGRDRSVNHHTGMFAYARMWLVLGAVYELCVKGARATQRELYYHLKPSEMFKNPATLNNTLQGTCVRASSKR
jgi:DNA topoisomerase VI subunit A